MTTTIPPAKKRERLDAATYKVAQAADRAQVSERQVWRWIDSRQLPGVLRVGRIVRISKKLFDEWLENGGAK